MYTFVSRKFLAFEVLIINIVSMPKQIPMLVHEDMMSPNEEYDNFITNFKNNGGTLSMLMDYYIIERKIIMSEMKKVLKENEVVRDYFSLEKKVEPIENYFFFKLLI